MKKVYNVAKEKEIINANVNEEKGLQIMKKKLTQKVLYTIETQKMIEKGDFVLLGLSGGPDSLCLFHVLMELREVIGFKLGAVHINHGFRPGAAEEDQRFVEEICRQNNILCVSKTFDCAKIAKELGLSSEEAGRKIRYEVFDQAADAVSETEGLSKDCIKIAVAQNADDQAETLLFRLMRGTGLDGLAGMEYKRLSRKGYTIIRPLLGAERKEIEEYCAENHLKPCIDITNLQPVYARNKIRLELIPLLEKQYNPNISQTLLRLSESAGEDKAYLWETAQKVYSEILIDSNAKDIRLKLDDLKELHPALRHRIIALAFSKIGLDSDVQRQNYLVADSLIEQGKTGSKIDFPHGYEMSISYDKVIASRKDEETIAYRKDNEGANPLHDKICRILSINDIYENAGRLSLEVEGKTGKKIVIERSNFTEGKFDGGLWEKGARTPIIRCRQEGDYLYIADDKRKTIKEFMIDAKIPKDVRGEIPLVCIGKEVLAILGDDLTGLSTGLKKTRFTALK